MSPSLGMNLFVLGLFFALLAAIQAGRWLGQRAAAAEAETWRAGLGVVAGAVFGLLGLLIAFSFARAETRFDARRQLIVQEVNAIGTAYLRLDLLPAEPQAELRRDFRRYVEARLALYAKLPDIRAARLELAHTRALQEVIWRKAVAAGASGATPQASLLLLPALNEMIDITATRTLALQTHTPWIVFALLAAVAVACALLVGHAMAEGRMRGWVYAVIFAAVLTATIQVIVDLEYPRLGLIRIQAVERMMADLLEGIKQ